MCEGKQIYIPQELWEDENFKSLPAEAKLFYLRLMSFTGIPPSNIPKFITEIGKKKDKKDCGLAIVKMIKNEQGGK